jgi:hypothetical protein
MAQRGRKSALSLTLSPRLEAMQRPDAPYDLTDDETAEWVAILGRMAADWFPRETHPLLTQLCRHIVSSRRLAQLIGATVKAKKLNALQQYALRALQACFQCDRIRGILPSQSRSPDNSSGLGRPRKLDWCS